jgi:PEGA domain
MSRSLALLFCSVALAGCTAGGDLMKTAIPTVPLQFESDPPGAEVRTSGGQTCRTPCALAVPAADMQVTYNLNGYQPQTVPVKLMPPDMMQDPGEFGGPFSTPRFSPSPVVAELVRATRRGGPAKKSPAKIAKRPPQPQAEAEPRDGGFAPPPQTSGFNAPPPQQQQAPSGGGFPPPGQQQRGGAAPAASAPATSAWPAPNSQTR